jgi:hypothetical protein
MKDTTDPNQRQNLDQTASLIRHAMAQTAAEHGIRPDVVAAGALAAAVSECTATMGGNRAAVMLRQAATRVEPMPSIAHAILQSTPPAGSA